MTPDPAATSLPGTRLLAFAQAWLPPAVVATVFEPLVADWQREVADARSRRSHLRLRLQWTAAFLSAFMLSGLRQVAVLPPARLVAGAGARGVLMAGFGFVLQRTFQRPHDVPGLNAALVDSLPFAIIAIVDGIRFAALPFYRRRLLAAQVVLAAAMILALLGSTVLAQRAALALMAIVLGIFGWTLRALHERRPGGWRWVATTTLIASALSLSAYPLKWSLGMNVFARWWGGDVMYSLAIVTILYWVFESRRHKTQGGPEDPPLPSISR